jgi:molybdopterin adenylyltransferase
MMLTAAILTASDACAAGQRADRSGDWLAARLAGAFEVQARAVVPDEADQIAGCLRQWVTAGIRLIVTTGGTGLGPRDVTPEAVRQVIEREVPGLAEAMRVLTFEREPRAMLSRQVAGAVGATLIISLPGSPRAVEECLDAIWPVLPHALDLLAGHTTHLKEGQSPR